MQSTIKPSDLRTSQLTHGLELLSFRLGEEEYGVGIEYVQELRSYTSATSIANAPAYMKGVINLRGAIVPILDLRIKFALEAAPYDHLTVVIIFCVDGRQVGAVVDGVSDVVVLDAADIKPMPRMNTAIDDGLVTGVGALGERMIMLVDIARLLSESLGLDQAAAA